MSFAAAVSACLRKYFVFSGRARRSEFWYFRLFLVLVFATVFLLVLFGGSTARTSDEVQGEANGVAALFMLLWVAAIIPDLAASVRRLHDTDRSGLWMLIAFVPLGGFVLFVFFCLEGTRGANRFGPDPLESHADVFR